LGRVLGDRPFAGLGALRRRARLGPFGALTGPGEPAQQLSADARRHLAEQLSSRATERAGGGADDARLRESPEAPLVARGGDGVLDHVADRAGQPGTADTACPAGQTFAGYTDDDAGGDAGDLGL